MKLLSLFIAFSISIPACIIVVDDEGSLVSSSWTTERGSGTAATETRTLAPFTRIRIDGSIDLAAAPGAAQVVTVTADDNLVGRITTRVEDGVLVVGMQPGSYSFRKSPRIVVAYSSLAGLAIVGSGDASVEGLQGQSFRIDISGSGDAELSGKVERLDATIAGSGDIDAFELEARDAVVSICGSGAAHVHASAKIDASVAGSGDVRFRGAPSDVQKSVTGSGTIEAMSSRD